MLSKLEAARLALGRGIPVVIADGREANVLKKSVQRTPPGTWVAP
jgi:glutamate 5-kinase